MDKIKEFFSVSTSSSRKPEHKEFFQISGAASFRTEINISGKPPYSSSVLSVTSVGESGLVIGSKCQWFRSYHSQDVPIAASGNTYLVSALDIGAKIKVKVVPTEPGESGELAVEFGPILMDHNQKNTLKNVIKSGGARFDFESISPFDIDEGIHGGTLVVFQNHIKINMRSSSHPGFRVYFGENFTVKSGSDENSLTFEFNDSIKARDLAEFFSLKAGQSSNHMKIRFISQLSRDNVAIAVRAFEGMIDLKDRIIIDKALENCSSIDAASVGLSRQPAISVEDIYGHLINNSLQRELDLLSKSNKTISEEKEKFYLLVNNLDGEITRSQYFMRLQSSETDIYNSNPMMLSDEDPSRVIRKLKKENKALGMQQETAIQEHEALEDKLQRMKENLQNMKYSDTNESKINMTTNQLNR